MMSAQKPAANSRILTGKNFNRYSDLTLKNVAICPAAYNIVEEMKKKLPL